MDIQTVSSGRAPSVSIKALYICSGVPSKNLPQPAAKRVSPEKSSTQHASLNNVKVKIYCI